MFEASKYWDIDIQTGEINFTAPMDIKKEYEDLFTSLFPGISLEPFTPQGQLIAHLVHNDLTIIKFLKDYTNYFFFGGEGIMLDTWAWNHFRITRRGEEKGSVSIKINGTPLTVVESNPDNTFKVTDGILKFELLHDVLLDDNGEATADFRSIDFNTHVAKKNTIIEILTPRVNVERVNNPQDSNPGVPIESDSLLYARCINYGSVFKNSSFRSIVSNLLQTPGVIKVNAHENFGIQAITYKGVSIPPHGIALVILGGSLSDIGNTILRTKTPGAAMAGDVEIELLYEKHKIKYKIFRPEEVPLKVEVTIIPNLRMPANYEELIQDKLINYINELDIGADITQPEITCSVTSLGFTIKDVKIGKKSDGAVSYNPINLQFKQMAVLDKQDITIKK